MGDTKNVCMCSLRKSGLKAGVGEKLAELTVTPLTDTEIRQDRPAKVIPAHVYSENIGSEHCY